MLDLIKDISHNKGVNVLISSHLLPDIERVCDRVVVVLRGKLVSQGTIRDLKKIDGQPLDVDLRETNEAFVTKIKANGGYAAPTTYTTVRVQIAGTREHAMNAILQIAKDSGAQVRGVKLAERSLEEAFLSAVQA
jgi:ABC-2 type transport system ATP-binding protein